MNATLDKPRSDAWYGELDEVQLWRLWDLHRRSPWYEVTEYAQKEYGIAGISRSAYYRWVAWMQPQVSERRLLAAEMATAEIEKIAKGVGLDDAKAVAAYKSLGAEVALRTGSATAAAKYIEMATAIQDRLLKQQELALKERAQATKDDALKLAREKFEAAEKRLAAVQGAVDEPQLSDAERVAKIKSIFGMR